MAKAVQIMTNGAYGTVATQFRVESKTIAVVAEGRDGTGAGVKLARDLPFSLVMASISSASICISGASGLVIDFPLKAE